MPATSEFSLDADGVDRRAIVAGGVAVAGGAALLVAALSAGPLTRAPRYPVRGSVVLDGLYPAGAVVALHPLDSPRWVYAPHTGVVQADGAFEIGADRDRGAPPGQYAVTIVWRPLEVRGEAITPAENVVPSRYARPQTTPLRVAVAAAANQLPPFEITTTSRDRFGHYLHQPALAPEASRPSR